MMIPASYRSLSGTLAYQIMGVMGGGLPFPAPPEPPAPPKHAPDVDDDMPAGVSVSQWRAYNTPATAVVLGCLVRGEQTRTQEVADRSGYSRPTVNRILATAHVLGLVTREHKQIGRWRGDVWGVV